MSLDDSNLYVSVCEVVFKVVHFMFMDSVVYFIVNS